MSTKRTLCTLAVTALLAEAALGQQIAGLGAAPCSEFVKAYAQKADSPAPVYLAWSQGFMSSMNLVRSRRHLKARLLGNSREYTPGKQLAYLAQYCRSNPSRDFLAATLDLYIHLPPQK